MKKIEFYVHPIVGKELKLTDKKYILLYYYISDFVKDITTIERVVDELTVVQSGAKTFTEVFEDIYGVISISVEAGEFECDSEKAYFISNNPEFEPSLEMPLQELIDLLNSWKGFLQED